MALLQLLQKTIVLNLINPFVYLMSSHSFLYLIFFSIVSMTFALDAQSPRTYNDLSEASKNWKTKAIYQILTDRFNNLESDAPCNDFGDYCGGTFRGTCFRDLKYSSFLRNRF